MEEEIESLLTLYNDKDFSGTGATSLFEIVANRIDDRIVEYSNMCNVLDDLIEERTRENEMIDK